MKTGLRAVVQKLLSALILAALVELEDTAVLHADWLLGERRNDTYIVRHEDGRFNQVGRNCLKDFTGHQDPAALASYAELLAEIGEFMSSDEEFEGGAHGTRYWSLGNLVSLAATVIRIDGWVSRKTAEEQQRQSTASAVSAILNSKGDDRTKLLAKYEAATEDGALATKAIEWAQNLPSDTGNDYLWNLRVVASLEIIDSRKFGLACAMVASYAREVEKQNLYRASAGKKPSEHFGVVKKRETFTLTLLGVFPIQNDFGVTNIHRFMDQEGNVAVWFASNGGTLTTSVDGEVTGPAQGDTVEVKASVKEHSVYNGTKQTILIRVVCQKWQPAAAEPIAA